MKYENFRQVKEIVEKIEKYQGKLNELERYNARVVISTNAGEVYDIPADKLEPHDYSEPAEELIQLIRKDLQRRIDNNKVVLEGL